MISNTHGGGRNLMPVVMGGWAISATRAPTRPPHRSDNLSPLWEVARRGWRCLLHGASPRVQRAGIPPQTSNSQRRGSDRASLASAPRGFHAAAPQRGTAAARLTIPSPAEDYRHE
jgi:hypothetical protein